MAVGRDTDALAGADQLDDHRGCAIRFAETRRALYREHRVIQSECQALNREPAVFSLGNEGIVGVLPAAWRIANQQLAGRAERAALFQDVAPECEQARRVR